MSPLRRSRSRRIIVNGAFRPQRVTGQQRYAIEIADRLIQAGAYEVRPGRFWGGSSVRTWLWSLVVLPFRTWGSVLISLTARAPVLHPRHLLAVHDLFVLTNPEWYSKNYIRSHVPMLRWQLRFASALVAVSQSVADQVGTRARSGHVAVAPNAPSAGFLDAGGAAAFERTGLESGKFLLAIGSMDPRKNLRRLAAAWSAVPQEVRRQCPLAIVGGGAAIYAQGAIEWPPETIVTGYVPDADLAGLYGAAKAVVFVSLAEGFGLPIVEAAAAGVDRFVLSDIEVFRWIAGDGALYVDPLSESAIAEALTSVARSDASTAGTVEVRRFTWQSSAETIMSAAERLSVE